MRQLRYAGVALCLVLLSPAAQAQSEDLRALLAAPVQSDHPGAIADVLIELRFGKLFLTAEINGEAGEFIFDTGSPTILSAELAIRLGLEFIGENTGTDANGNRLTMNFVRLDELQLGEVRFYDVPVLVYDFSGLDSGSCLIGDGVIGSEILPGYAWQIDTGAGQLRIAASAEEWASGAVAATAPLNDFGYPHAPIVDYALGDISDRALFDTGNTSDLALFDAVADQAIASGAVQPDSLQTGFGYEGESAGGRGDPVALRRFRLDGLRLGTQILNDIPAIGRAHPPTLLGAGLLGRYLVTLDYPGGQFLLHHRPDSGAPRPAAGFGLLIVDGGVEVTQLYASSAASTAGLELGDHILSVDGRDMTVPPAGDRCELVRFLAGDFNASEASELVVRRGSDTMTITIDR